MLKRSKIKDDIIHCGMHNENLIFLCLQRPTSTGGSTLKTKSCTLEPDVGGIHCTLAIHTSATSWLI
jgi:hypothetical protein